MPSHQEMGNLAQAALLTRFRRLPRERRRALLGAFVVLAAASFAIAFLPFRTAIGFGSIPLRRRSETKSDDCVWAVETAARRMPWRTACIQKGIAVQRLLRSGGVDAVLHYGARYGGESEPLEAHVWVSVEGTGIIGHEEAPGFAEIAVFP